MREEFYLNKLYPLQDKVLQVMKDLNSKFYLTGGTVVSRFIASHRYSDDLDFFLNMDKDFLLEATKVKDKLSLHFRSNIEVTYNSDTFYRIMVTDADTVLKLDFVNDVGFHSGDFVENLYYHKLDNAKNILSNKLSALQRNAAKDISDILFLSFTQVFNWLDIIEDAQKKDTWVNEIDVATYLDSYDISQLETVLWTKVPDYNYLKQCLHTIAKDILLGAENSLKS